MRLFTHVAAVAALTITAAPLAQARPIGNPGPIIISPICFTSPYDPTHPDDAIDCCLDGFPALPYCDDVMMDALYTAGDSGLSSDAMTYGQLVKAKADISIEGTVQSVFWAACMVGSSLGWIAGGGAPDQADDEALDNCSNYESE